MQHDCHPKQYVFSCTVVFKKRYLTVTENTDPFCMEKDKILYSLLSLNAWFNLTCYLAPSGRAPGDLEFFLSWWSIPLPRACRGGQFPTPQLLIDLMHVTFLAGGVYLFESNSDFRTIAKRVVFRTFVKVF